MMTNLQISVYVKMQRFMAINLQELQKLSHKKVQDHASEREKKILFIDTIIIRELVCMLKCRESISYLKIQKKTEIIYLLFNAFVTQTNNAFVTQKNNAYVTQTKVTSIIMKHNIYLI